MKTIVEMAHEANVLIFDRLNLITSDIDGLNRFAALVRADERPWQGLTKEEIDSALSKYQNWYDFAAHLENILKEKNQ